MTAVVLTAGSADIILQLPGGRRKLLATAGEGTLLPAIDGERIAVELRSGATTLDADRFPADFLYGYPAQAWLTLLGAPADKAAAPTSGHRLSAEQLQQRTQSRIDEILDAERRAGERRAMEDAMHSAQSQERVARTVGDFARLLEGRFRRHDPRDADRPPLLRAARLAATSLGLRLADIEPADGESDDAFLERFAAACGARLRRVSLENLDALEGEGPVIAYSEQGRPVVLLPRRFSGLTTIDPVTMAPASGSVSSLGFALHPVLPDGPRTYRSLLAFGLGACSAGLVSIALCGIGESLLGLLLPVAYAFAANVIIPTDNVSLLVLLCSGLVLALIIQTGLHVTGQFARAQVEGRAGMALHAAMVDRVLRLPLAVLRQSSTAILATQTETVTSFRRSMLDCAINFFLAAAHGILAAGLLCFYSPAAGLAAIASVVVLLGVTALIGRLQFKAIYEGERMDVVVLTFIYDLIRLVPILQAQRAERQAFVQWGQNFLAFQSRLVRSTRISNALGAFQACWEVVTLGLCFVAVAWLGLGGALATGAAVAFVIALARLNAAGLQASQALLGMAKLMPMAKLARPLIEQPVMPLVSGAAVPTLRGEVGLVRVGFAYGTRNVLEDASLHIRAGEFIAITGPSGSGKSTLLRLILGLDTPRSGATLIDGMDVRALDQASLARQVGVVLQNGQLWAGTIFENMRGASDLSVDEAHALAGRVGLRADLEAMPMGLQTIVGDGGLGLSGGQMQRILIARAIAGQPRILVMDEPAGSLRGPDRMQLRRLLEELDMTRIVVSHDVELLAGASRLFRLEHGQLKKIDVPAGAASRESVPC
jgi:ABC-type bacteriocin/lantibiotic exporter with double-glycine peptidase domain